MLAAALFTVAGRDAPALAAGPGYYPTSWTTASPLLGVRVSDSGGSGIDVASSYLSVDGARLVTALDRASGELRASASDLAAGGHTASVYAADFAGNSMTFSWAFKVDNEAPVLVGDTPVGSITTRTPRIAVTASDALSGIDGATPHVQLTRSPLSSTVRSTFDSDSGVIAYQVPTVPTGIGLGQFALPDGHYDVGATVKDFAGNATTLSWSFDVHTLT